MSRKNSKSSTHENLGWRVRLTNVRPVFRPHVGDGGTNPDIARGPVLLKSRATQRAGQGRSATRAWVRLTGGGEGTHARLSCRRSSACKGQSTGPATVGAATHSYCHPKPDRDLAQARLRKAPVPLPVPGSGDRVRHGARPDPAGAGGPS